MPRQSHIKAANAIDFVSRTIQGRHVVQAPPSVPSAQILTRQITNSGLRHVLAVHGGILVHQSNATQLGKSRPPGTLGDLSFQHAYGVSHFEVVAQLTKRYNEGTQADWAHESDPFCIVAAGAIAQVIPLPLASSLYIGPFEQALFQHGMNSAPSVVLGGGMASVALSGLTRELFVQTLLRSCSLQQMQNAQAAGALSSFLNHSNASAFQTKSSIWLFKNHAVVTDWSRSSALQAIVNPSMQLTLLFDYKQKSNRKSNSMARARILDSKGRGIALLYVYELHRASGTQHEMRLKLLPGLFY